MKSILIALPLLLSGCSTLGFEEVPEGDALVIQIERDKTYYENLIIRHEGYSRKPYMDAGGIAIGHGTNLTRRGLSQEEARYLLRNDLERLKKELPKRFPVVETLDSARYAVILSMAYNLGIEGLSKFDRMWMNIERRDYIRASTEMYLSDWCGQVGQRCSDLADMMWYGK